MFIKDVLAIALGILLAELIKLGLMFVVLAFVR
jgi:hypothetical protein